MAARPKLRDQALPGSKTRARAQFFVPAKPLGVSQRCKATPLHRRQLLMKWLRRFSARQASVCAPLPQFAVANAINYSRIAM